MVSKYKYTQKILVWDIATVIEMYTGHAFQNAHVYMSDITRCKKKFPIMHISRDALIFRTQVDYLEIHSACFEVTKDYD